MSETAPTNRPESIEDNARKFLVDKIDPEFLKANNATSFTLTVDWIETGEENEKKVVQKVLESGATQIILISKITKDGKRIAERKEITAEEYAALLPSSVRHLEKKRYEFKVTQDKTPFSIKYDEFSGGNFQLLEVDAQTEVERNSFNPAEFPNNLSEVTADPRYSGYKITEML